jgi:hypothetical protein
LLLVFGWLQGLGAGAWLGSAGWLGPFFYAGDGAEVEVSLLAEARLGLVLSAAGIWRGAARAIRMLASWYVIAFRTFDSHQILIWSRKETESSR